MEKFKTNLATQIEKFEIVKETKTRITYKFSDCLDKTKFYERTENKMSQYHSWHDNFEMAKLHLIAINNRRIERLKQQILYYKRHTDILVEFKEENI